MHEAGQGSHAPSCAVGGRKNEPLIIGIICQNVNRSLVEILRVAINDHSCRYIFKRQAGEDNASISLLHQASLTPGNELARSCYSFHQNNIVAWL